MRLATVNVEVFSASDTYLDCFAISVLAREDDFEAVQRSLRDRILVLADLMAPDCRLEYDLTDRVNIYFSEIS